MHGYTEYKQNKAQHIRTQVYVNDTRFEFVYFLMYNLQTHLDMP